MSKIQKLSRGEIWLANLNPNKGIEPGKTRPVLIIQNQILLDVGHPSTLIIPLTTQLVDDAYPLRIRVKAKSELKTDSDLLIDQIRAIDNQRLSQGPLMKLSDTKMIMVQEAVCEVMGMDLELPKCSSFQIL